MIDDCGATGSDIAAETHWAWLNPCSGTSLPLGSGIRQGGGGGVGTGPLPDPRSRW